MPYVCVCVCMCCCISPTPVASIPFFEISNNNTKFDHGVYDDDDDDNDYDKEWKLDDMDQDQAVISLFLDMLRSNVQPKRIKFIHGACAFCVAKTA